MRLTPSLSAYLDALRFMAALSVLLGHMMSHGFDIGWLPLAHLSHEAVIVFFVMSGFIIASTTYQRQLGWQDYAAARAARIYSVALPAVVFSLILSAVVLGIDAPEGKSIDALREPAFSDALSSLLFLNESWWISFGLNPRLSLNGPYWSLCYEVWYYTLFGVFVFLQGRWRWPALGLIALLAGPAVMVMFPIWCIGAWLATQRPGVAQERRGWLLGFAVAPLMLLFVELTAFDLGIRDLIKERVSGWWHLGSSQRFLTDMLLGVAVACHLHAFQRAPDAVHRVLESRAKGLAALAGFSFTLYLFHMPIATVLGALVPASMKGPVASIAWTSGVVALCWSISFATERRLPRWRRWFGRLVAVR